MIRSIALAAALLTLALAGCQTTGDPSAGGLFGWSPSKARQDVAALEQDAAATHRQAMEEQQKTAAMQARRTEVRSEVSDLQARLQRATAENEQLEGQLRALMQARRLGAAELDRLNRQLVENEQLREAARHAVAPQTVDKVNDRNAQLRRQITLLSED